MSYQLLCRCYREYSCWPGELKQVAFGKQRLRWLDQHRRHGEHGYSQIQDLPLHHLPSSPSACVLQPAPFHLQSSHHHLRYIHPIRSPHHRLAHLKRYEYCFLGPFCQLLHPWLLLLPSLSPRHLRPCDRRSQHVQATDRPSRDSAFSILRRKGIEQRREENRKIRDHTSPSVTRLCPTMKK